MNDQRSINTHGARSYAKSKGRMQMRRAEHTRMLARLGNGYICVHVYTPIPTQLLDYPAFK